MIWSRNIECGFVDSILSCGQAENRHSCSIHPSKTEEAQQPPHAGCSAWSSHISSSKLPQGLEFWPQRTFPYICITAGNDEDVSGPASDLKRKKKKKCFQWLCETGPANILCCQTAFRLVKNIYGYPLHSDANERLKEIWRTLFFQGSKHNNCGVKYNLLEMQVDA